MRIELSRRALADLDDIRDFSVRQFGTDRAILYLDAIEEALRRMLEHPAIGARRPELGSSMRSYPVGEHRIFYRLGTGTILVVRLLHKAMDVERHL